LKFIYAILILFNINIGFAGDTLWERDNSSAAHQNEIQVRYDGSINTKGRNINWNRYIEKSELYKEIITEFSCVYELDSDLVEAVISYESNWTERARCGISRGLMQVNGASYEPSANIKAGCSILRGNIIAFKGNILMALTGYNRGTARARKKGHPNDYAYAVCRVWSRIKKYKQNLIVYKILAP